MKYTTFALTLTILLYATYYQETGRIWGKFDVDNYLYLPYIELEGMALRHILILTLIRDLPTWTMTILIPLLYWFGNVYPIRRLYGRNAAFCYVFGTGSLSLCLTVGLWSQYLCISLLLWSLLLYERGHLIIPGMLFLLSLTYIPVWYYYLTLILPTSYAILLTMMLMLIQPNDFWWMNNNWNPAFTLLLMVCPVIWIKLFFGRERLDERGQTLTFIYTLTRLSRALVFWLPRMKTQTNTLERCIIIGWFLTTTYIYAFF